MQFKFCSLYCYSLVDLFWYKLKVYISTHTIENMRRTPCKYRGGLVSNWTFHCRCHLLSCRWMILMFPRVIIEVVPKAYSPRAIHVMLWNVFGGRMCIKWIGPIAGAWCRCLLLSFGWMILMFPRFLIVARGYSDLVFKDRGVPLEPQNPYPSLQAILAERGTHC